MSGMEGEKRSRTDTPRYYRVSPRFWKDERVSQWDDNAKLLALHLLTSPHRTPEGIFVLPISYLVADLNWRRRKIEQSLSVLTQSGFLSFDSRTNVFLIRNALKYQVPENPNQSESVMRRIKELPNTELLQEFGQLAKVHCYRSGAGSAAQAFSQRLEQVLRQRLVQSLTLTPTETFNTNRQSETLNSSAALGSEEYVSSKCEESGRKKEVDMGSEQETAFYTGETHLPQFLRQVNSLGPSLAYPPRRRG